MSDEHSQRSASADPSPGSSESADDPDGRSSDDLEPGGGPHRVVSDQSVDDILNSLDETKSASEAVETNTSAATDSSDASASPETGESVTNEFDEDEIPATEENGAEPIANDDARAPSDDGSKSAATIDAAASALRDDATISDDAGPAERSDDEDASLEELAARIEDGAVTGADVRAAEAGEGRESTPDVDEIELSMDDLEATQERNESPSRGRGPAVAGDGGDDAGPLAGSVPREAAGDSSDAGRDEGAGLLGRIKRFFSG